MTGIPLDQDTVLIGGETFRAQCNRLVQTDTPADDGRLVYASDRQLLLKLRSQLR